MQSKEGGAARGREGTGKETEQRERKERAGQAEGKEEVAPHHTTHLQQSPPPGTKQAGMRRMGGMVQDSCLPTP